MEYPARTVSPTVRTGWRCCGDASVRCGRSFFGLILACFREGFDTQEGNSELAATGTHLPRQSGHPLPGHAREESPGGRRSKTPPTPTSGRARRETPGERRSRTHPRPPQPKLGKKSLGSPVVSFAPRTSRGALRLRLPGSGRRILWPHLRPVPRTPLFHHSTLVRCASTLGRPIVRALITARHL